MTFIPKPQLFTGIEETPTSFKMVTIKKKKNGVLFPVMQEIPHEELYDKLPKMGKLAHAIGGKDLLVKTLFIPVKGDKKIAAAFDFQIEPHLPYSLDKCIVNYMKGEEKESGTSLTSFSVKKESIARHLDLCKQCCDFEPDLLLSSALALFALSQELPPSPQPFFFIHIGFQEGTCVLIEKGAILAVRSFEKEKKEIEKTFLFLSSTYKSKKIEQAFLLTEEKGWDEIISEILGIKVLPPSFPSLPLALSELQKYGLGLGLALGAKAKLPNFRQKEFALPFSWKKWRSPILAASILLFSLFTSLVFVERSFLKKREEALCNRFSSIFKTVPTSLPQLDEALVSIEKKMETTPDLFPLLPEVPKVQDVLSWLSSCPQCPNIEDFKYTMVKRPSLNEQEHHYLVKVDIQFSGSPDHVRPFLSNPNPFVDSKKEIEWKIDRGSLFVSFYLKDKTPYFP